MISDRARMSGISLRLAVACIFLTSAALGTTTTSHRINGQIEGLNKAAPSLSSYGHNHGGGQELLMPAILLGAAGEHSLLAWSSWAEDAASSHRTPPALWVVCADTAAFAAFVVQTPYVSPFYVSDESSWATVLQDFLSRKPHVWTVGLLGEGALPHPGLMDSIHSMQFALFEALPSPTAVLTRSRSTGSHPGQERWLSDKFVSQLWCNRAALEASMLTAAGLNALSARDVTLLQMLPRLVRDAVERQMVLVDGTHVINSFFDAPPASPASGTGEYPGTSSQHLQNPQLMGAGADVHIGSLDFALVYNGGDIARGKLQEKGQEAAAITTSSIVKAPWPPEYILETVAMNTTAVESKGLVLVSNVNCGYLDMATNFLLTVRNTSDAKVSYGWVQPIAVYNQAYILSIRTRMEIRKLSYEFIFCLPFHAVCLELYTAKVPAETMGLDLHVFRFQHHPGILVAQCTCSINASTSSTPSVRADSSPYTCLW